MSKKSTLLLDSNPTIYNSSMSLIEKTVKGKNISNESQLIEENKNKIQTFLLIKKNKSNHAFPSSNLTLILYKNESIDAHITHSRVLDPNKLSNIKTISDITKTQIIKPSILLSKPKEILNKSLSSPFLSTNY